MKIIIALLTLFLTLPATAFAERSQTFGDIEVHFNALSTTELSPDMAKAYQLERSKNRGMITVAVLKKDKAGVGHPIKATISANAVNLSSQLSDMTMREIQEGKAIYYLGDYRVSAPDTLKFKVAIKPQGENKTLNVEFQQPFFP